MIRSRYRGRFEPPEVYSTHPVGDCPGCRNDIDEDEAHAALDGILHHRECLPFCDDCKDALMFDTCPEGCNVVHPVIKAWLEDVKTKRRAPLYDYAFAGVFCDFCFTRRFFPEGD